MSQFSTPDSSGSSSYDQSNRTSSGYVCVPPVATTSTATVEEIQMLTTPPDHAVTFTRKNENAFDRDIEEQVLVGTFAPEPTLGALMMPDNSYVDAVITQRNEGEPFSASAAPATEVLAAVEIKGRADQLTLGQDGRIYTSKGSVNYLYLGVEKTGALERLKEATDITILVVYCLSNAIVTVDFREAGAASGRRIVQARYPVKKDGRDTYPMLVPAYPGDFTVVRTFTDAEAAWFKAKATFAKRARGNRR